MLVKMNGVELFEQTYALLKAKHRHLTKKQLKKLTKEVLDDMVRTNVISCVQ